MSLYKGGETSLYFKKIAEKEEGSNKDSGAPKIKQSRAARILSVKNDLVCIKENMINQGSPLNDKHGFFK